MITSIRKLKEELARLEHGRGTQGDRASAIDDLPLEIRLGYDDGDKWTADTISVVGGVVVITAQ